MTLPALLVAVFLAAPSSAQMTAPPDLADLCEGFQAELDDQKKAALLAQIGRTAPSDSRDVTALATLFSRYHDARVRDAIISSIERTDPSSQQLEATYTGLIADTDPSNEFLGIKGALRLRAESAYPLIDKIARSKFKLSDPDASSALPTESDRWWVHYEALYSLAVWDGDRAFPLVLKMSKQAPKLARILALRYWKQSLPLIARWSGGNTRDRMRAAAALASAPPLPALRETRAQMLALVEDPKADAELRHQLAIKVGLCSTDEEVARLWQRYPSADDALKLYLAAVIFASRSQNAVPLLTQYAKENASPVERAGARVELKELLKPADYRAIVEWAAQSDPDAENRAVAQKELATLEK